MACLIGPLYYVPGNDVECQLRTMDSDAEESSTVSEDIQSFKCRENVRCLEGLSSCCRLSFQTRLPINSGASRILGVFEKYI